MSLELEDLLKKCSRVSELCRLCLSGGAQGEGGALTARESAERVLLVTGVKMEDSASLPGVICAPCSRELDAATCFRLKCQHSDRLLREYFLACVLKAEAEGDYKRQPWGDQDTRGDSEHTGTHSTEDILPKIDTSTDVKSEIITPEVVRVKKKKSKSKKNIPIIYEELPIKEEVDDMSDGRDMSDAAPEEEDTEHMTAKEKKEKKKFLCPTCGKPLTSVAAVRAHAARMHRGGRQRAPNITGFGPARRFHCTECPYSTPYGQSLKYHLRVHSGEKPYRCPECDRCFSQPGRLTSHRKTHSDKMYFTCAQCGRQFKHKDTYEAHQKVHKERGEYECKQCGKALKSKETLEAHMNRHNNIRNHSCETCGATFVARTELINHARNHNTEKNYLCPYCDFRTHTKKILDPHVRRHSGERPHKCGTCAMACYTAVELKYHMRRHSKDKPFACPQCELLFKYSSSVSRHMLKAHHIKFKRSDHIDRRIIK